MSDAAFQPTVLMLEHDEDDRFITSSIVDDLHYNVHVEYITYSNELFSYLDNCRDNNLPYPSLILITLKSTPLDGKKILSELKSNEHYKHIPVVLLTELKDKPVIKECYALGASSFIQKPSSNKGNQEKIATFFKYWFETAELT